MPHTSGLPYTSTALLCSTIYFQHSAPLICSIPQLLHSAHRSTFLGPLTPPDVLGYDAARGPVHNKMRTAWLLGATLLGIQDGWGGEEGWQPCWHCRRGCRSAPCSGGSSRLYWLLPLAGPVALHPAHGKKMAALMGVAISAAVSLLVGGAMTVMAAKPVLEGWG